MAIVKVNHSNVAARAIVAAMALCVAVAAIGAPSLKALQTGSKHLQLGSVPYDLTLADSKKSVADARAVSMVSADFNLDGYADLISGYAQGEGGYISLHHGNPEAYASTSPATFENLKRGIFPPGFVSESVIFNLPVAPELLVAGDFNADGKADLVFAKRGDTAIYFVPGSRAGFGVAQKIPVAGTVDAMVAGKVGLPTGGIDLVLGISGNSGPTLQIFRGGVDGKPAVYTLAAAADQLAVGNLDDDQLGDVAILAGGQVAILHGYNQRLSTPEFARLETLALGSKVQSFVLGDFIWDRDGKSEIALLQPDGTVAIAARGALDTTPFSMAEVREKRRAQTSGKSAIRTSWQPGAGGTWAIAESNAAGTGKAAYGPGAKLLRANLSGQASDDLIVVDSIGQTLTVLTVEGLQRKGYSVSASGAPVAALSMPTSSFVLPSLIVLSAGSAAPSVLPSVPLAVFNVTKTTDTNDGFCNADCSLREAISAANASPGADNIVVPSGTYTLTIANAGGNNEDDNASGDLDITDSLTITGAAQATTIIQAGTTNTNGIDKVMALNPICGSALNMAINNATIRFGRNSQAFNAPDFSFTGGGIDVCNTGAGNFTMSSVLVDQNTNFNGYGGGVNFDSLQPANGNYSITASTISGNTMTSSGGNNGGGGINLFGDAHNVTLTNVGINGNTSGGQGGGIFARHSYGGAILIQGSTINGNTSANHGGGVSIANSGAATLTLNNDGFVQNNISQGTVAGFESRGGGIFVNVQSTTNTTINEMTITNNAANTGNFQGGGGIAAIGTGPLTVTFSRIAGNTAGTSGGAGLHNEGATVTGTRNWWGCNAGPTVAPCDLAVNASGTSTLAPRLQLAHSASPNTIAVGQTAALTANFSTDSAGGAVAIANLDAMIGTPHAFSGAVLGTLSAAQTSIQAPATATATFTGTAPGAGSANSVVDSQTQTANITIVKANTTTTITSDSPDPSGSGASVTVTYTVAVSSPGAGTPTGNVVVTISGGAETCTGTVAAGSCALTLTVGGARSFTASYVGDANFNSSSGTTAHTVTVLPQADLSITKTDGVSTVTAGGSVTYTITASNAGPDAVTGATVADTFPAALTCTWTCVGAGGGTCPASGSGNINNAVNLPTGASVTYTASCSLSASATGTLSNTATVSSAVSDPVPGNNSATDTDSITRQADLAITKTDGVTTVSAGGNTTYTIISSNAGPSNAPGSVVTDTFPASLTCTWTCVGAGGGTCTAAGAGNINDTVNLPSGGSVTHTASCSISLAASGTLSNTATITAAGGITEPSPGNNSATDSDTILTLASLSINDVSLAEGNAGTSNFTFTVNLSAPAGAGGVTFDIATANGTAVAGSDYVAQSLTAQTIPAGSSTYTFTVAVNGDTLNEANETFFVNVTGVTNAVVTDGQGQGTIVNDDPLPSISTSNVSVVEGNSGTTNAVVAVSLSAASGQSVTVNYATADGTATAPSDYTATSGTLTFTPGQTSRTITVLVNGDNTQEANETFTVVLSGATNATIASATSVVSIINDDVLITVSPTTLPAATVAAPYSQSITASGGVSPYVFTVSAGALPAGLTLSTGGALSGTATAGGSFNFTVLAADSSGAPGPFTGSHAYTLTVNPPTITLPASLLGDATLGSLYSAAITAATGGTAPYGYAVTVSTLPGGLNLNASSGAITGTPSASGTFNFSIAATDSSTGTGPYSATRAYSIVVLATQTISFGANPGPVTFSAGGTFSVSATGGASGNAVTYSVPTTTSVCSVNTTSGLVTMIAAGTCTVAANQAGNTNYAAATQATQNVVIGLGTQTVTFAPASPVVFGAAPITLTATATSGLTTFGFSTSSANTICTVAGNQLTIVGVGTCALGASQAGNANYAAASANASVVINQASQTVTFAPVTPVLVGAAPITLTATATSGLTNFSFATTSANTICTVAGNQLTIVGVGTCALSASQAGNANYTSAAASASIAVNANVPGAPVIGTATPGNGAASIAFAAPASDGGSAILDFTVTCNPGPQSATAAVSPIALSGLTNGTPYVCSVTARNAAGSSAPSATVSVSPSLTSYSGPTATGTGIATVTLSGGGLGCSFAPQGSAANQSAYFIAVAGHPKSPPTGSAPQLVEFPHGLLDFVLIGCAPGTTVTLSVTYPNPQISGTKYWKYGPTPTNAVAHWYVLPAMISGNTATFSITDGGLGDDDLQANGTIVDQGGPGIDLPPPVIPSLSKEALIALIALLLLIGAVRTRYCRRGRPWTNIEQ